MKTVLCIFLSISLLAGIANAQDAESYFSSGKAKARSGDFKGAVAEFNKAIELNPKDINYYLQRGMALGLTEDYEGAIKDYTTVLNNDPKQVFAYISRGGVYNKLKKYEKALSDFNQALNIDPENTEAYNNRGWAKKFLGDKAGACKDWKLSKKKGNDEAKIILKNNDC